MTFRRVNSWDKRQSTKPKTLGQVTPSVTTPVTIYTIPKNCETEVREVFIVNTANNADRDYKVYLDNDGNTYDNSTIISKGTVSKSLDGSRVLSITMDKEGGSIGVETSAADDLTFTMTGIERPKK